MHFPGQPQEGHRQDCEEAEASSESSSEAEVACHRYLSLCNWWGWAYHKLLNSNFLMLWWQVSVSPKSFWSVIGDLCDGPPFFCGFICLFVCLLGFGLFSGVLVLIQLKKTPSVRTKGFSHCSSHSSVERQGTKPFWDSSSKARSIYIPLYKIEETSSTWRYLIKIGVVFRSARE